MPFSCKHGQSSDTCEKCLKAKHGRMTAELGSLKDAANEASQLRSENSRLRSENADLRSELAKAAFLLKDKGSFLGRMLGGGHSRGSWGN